MQLQIRVGEAEMRLSVVGLQLDGSLKIINRLGLLLEIVQHESSIHVSCSHFRIELQRTRVFFERFLGFSIVRVDVAGNQGQIFIVGENWLVLLDQC